MFKNTINNEWNNALNSTNIENKDKDKYNDNKKNYNENKNRNDDDYDDYDDYNIKKNDHSSNNINYLKLKKDLAMSPMDTMRNNQQDRMETESNYNKVQKIPMKHKNRHHSRDYPRIEQKRIIRTNSSQKHISNLNLFNKTYDKTPQFKQNYNTNYNTNIDKSTLEKLTLKLKMRGLRGLMNLHKQFIFTCPHLSKITFPYFIHFNTYISQNHIFPFFYLYYIYILFIFS